MDSSGKLIRGLTLIDGIAIVIGTIIGTGVFLKTTSMAQMLGSPFWVLLAWIVGGLLSLTGALAYAELGSLMPEAGGEYHYLREGYGDLWGFLYGWMRFWIGSPGSIAAYAVGAMTFMSAMMSLEMFGGKTQAAVILIIVFSGLNCFSVAFGGRIQAIMTAVKVLTLIVISLGIFLFSKSADVSHLFQNSMPSGEFAGWSAFGAALISALWAYDGWSNLAMVGGEMQRPERNVPLALTIGMLAILGLYVLINLAYFFALPLTEVLNSTSTAFPNALPVATKAAMTFLGKSGVTILSSAFVFSAIGAMNGSILTSARVPFAMARDKLFFKQLSSVSDKGRVPVMAILVQAMVSIGLALSGTFDQLTDYVVFSAWIFFPMVTGVVFILRRRRPDAIREYKTFGYPFLPAIFILMSILLLINTLVTNTRSSLIGLAFILSGIPAFYFFRRMNRN